MTQATTFAAFVNRLSQLRVTGVGTRLSAPPSALNDADLPASWPQLPPTAGRSDGPMTLGSGGGWPTLTAELVVAFEAVAQSTRDANFLATVALVDAVGDALALATGLNQGPTTWSIRVGSVVVAGTEYWAVLAAVSGRG